VTHKKKEKFHGGQTILVQFSKFLETAHKWKNFISVDPVRHPRVQLSRQCRAAPARWLLSRACPKVFIIEN
jgi:hypothetical protein